MSTEPSTNGAAPTTNGHDQRGRFTKGNPGGPGNPFARRVAALRSALVASIGPDDIAAVARGLLARAKDGNVPAAKLLLAYSLGKPTPAPDPDRLDHDEWQRFRETAGLMEEVPPLMGRPDPDLLLNMIRVTRPGVTAEYTRQVVEMARDARKDARPPSPNGQNGARATDTASMSVLDPAVWAANVHAAAPSPIGHGEMAPQMKHR
jgi:hypothetical protein